MAIPLPLPSVADRVAGIIDALCSAVPTLIARDRSAGPLTILIYSRLRRLAARFAALAARVAAGILPAPRRRAAACSEMPAARPARPPRLLPAGFGWLARLVPGAACFGGQLQHLLLTDPEMASLLAAAPQAGRMLRSLLWMTAIRPLPEILRRPARPARSAPPSAPLSLTKPAFLTWPPRLNTSLPPVPTKRRRRRRPDRAGAQHQRGNRLGSDRRRRRMTGSTACSAAPRRPGRSEPSHGLFVPLTKRHPGRAATRRRETWAEVPETPGRSPWVRRLRH